MPVAHVAHRRTDCAALWVIRPAAIRFDSIRATARVQDMTKMPRQCEPAATPPRPQCLADGGKIQRDSDKCPEQFCEWNPVRARAHTCTHTHARARTRTHALAHTHARKSTHCCCCYYDYTGNGTARPFEHARVSESAAQCSPACITAQCRNRGRAGGSLVRPQALHRAACIEHAPLRHIY